MEQMTATEWSTVRDYYTELLAEQKEQHGRMQADVAAAGGLSGQNAISKIISNHHLGPSVETFLKAVVGLGLRPSAFFLQLEQRVSSPSVLNVSSSSSQRRRDAPPPRLAHRRPPRVFTYQDSIAPIDPVTSDLALTDLARTVQYVVAELERLKHAERLQRRADDLPDEVGAHPRRGERPVPKQSAGRARHRG